MRGLVVTAVVASWLAAAVPTYGATVTSEKHTESGGKGGLYTASTTTFTAAPGEANDVTVDDGHDGTIVIRDTGAPLTAQGLCTSVSESEARCPLVPYETAVKVMLGDGDDKARGGELTSVRIEAGDGNDQVDAGTAGLDVDAGPGDDVVHGGSGSDTIAGRGGHDMIDGGPGDDSIGDGSDLPCGESDTLDGGPGRDLLAYYEHTCAIHIDLADLAHAEGGPGEGDHLSGFESFYGGFGDDVIYGSGDPLNQLDGGAGNDVIDGRRGADYITGGEGDDTMIGGEGDDIIRDGLGASVVDGGPGRDFILTSDRADRIDAGDGDDEIDPGSGLDTVDAGAGDDSISIDTFLLPRQRPPAVIRCGAGRDDVRTADYTVYDPQRSSDLLIDCEDVNVGFDEYVTVRSPSLHGLTIFTGCGGDALRNCRIEVTVRANSGRVLATSTRVVPRTKFKNWIFRFRHPLKAGAIVAIEVRRTFRYPRDKQPIRQRGSFRMRL